MAKKKVRRRVPRTDQSVPERTCVVTHESGPPSSLVRVLVGPDGRVEVDLQGKGWFAGLAASWPELPVLERIWRIGGCVGGGAALYFAVLWAAGLRYRDFRPG